MSPFILSFLLKKIHRPTQFKGFLSTSIVIFVIYIYLYITNIFLYFLSSSSVTSSNFMFRRAQSRLTTNSIHIRNYLRLEYHFNYACKVVPFSYVNKFQNWIALDIFYNHFTVINLRNQNFCIKNYIGIKLLLNSISFNLYFEA